jgi:Protein of unknown function (DUF2889)
MPNFGPIALSRPARREHIHSRDIRCRGFRREDGLWDIEATLEDTKTYSFANQDRGGIAAGEPIHRMHMRLTVSDELEVRGAEAATEAGPFDLCGAITPVFASLIGLRIGPGWRKAVLERMGGVKGCTHLTELLLGPLTTTAMQTMAGARAAPAGNRRRPPPADPRHVPRARPHQRGGPATLARMAREGIARAASPIQRRVVRSASSRDQHFGRRSGSRPLRYLARRVEQRNAGTCPLATIRTTLRVIRLAFAMSNVDRRIKADASLRWLLQTLEFHYNLRKLPSPF